MNIGLVNGYSSITGGNGAITSAKMNGEESKFLDLVKGIQNKKESSLSSNQIAKSGKITGDIKSDFENDFANKIDKAVLPKGAAANQSNEHIQVKKIDKSSELYKKSLELESYFVKQMLSEMRKTVNKSALGSNDFAGKMYEDMLFDEYSMSMTKNAGFGLADQIYLSLT